MLSRTSITRLPRLFARPAFRLYSTPSDSVPANDPAKDSRPTKPNVSATNEPPTTVTGSRDGTVQESVQRGEQLRVMQAPNRAGIWSRNQQSREKAMVGPRFEQTVMEDQPRPLAAIELIHKQPVRWVHGRKASCDGGGGPLGHPRVFINVDKPEIMWCEYCGVPYANEHHRKAIEAQPTHSYPLDPVGDAAEVPVTQRVSEEPLGQR